MSIPKVPRRIRLHCVELRRLPADVNNADSVSVMTNENVVYTTTTLAGSTHFTPTATTTYTLSATRTGSQGKVFNETSDETVTVGE